MNQHLSNWLDKVEGLEPETTNNNIKKELRRQDCKTIKCYNETNG